MIKRCFLISIIFLANAAGSFAGDDEELVNNIFMLIYNQQFPEAEMILQTHNDKLEKSSFYFLTLDLNWWKFILSPSEMSSRQYNTLLKTIKSEKNIAAEDNINRLIWLSYQMRFELKRYNFFATAVLHSEIKKVLGEINENGAEYKEGKMKLFRLYTALFKYYDNILNPFFQESKRRARAEALNEIELLAIENSRVVSTLANYFLGKIYLDYEKKPAEGNRHYKILVEKYPHNRLFREMLAMSGK